jgi:cell wall-associated NlpC family hydrolase
MPPARGPLAHLLLRAALVLGVLLASCVAFGTSADALTRQQRQEVLHVAASKKGTPYRWGATGPKAFDCSGYTQWVFARVGERLPRTSRAQDRAVHHVRRVNRAPGDLVFFSSHHRVYHVGIYAGANTIWHAPHTGSRVSRERLWTSHVTYGRVS